LVRRQIRKACRKCRTIISKGGVCPSCGSTDLSIKWDGILIIINSENALLAEELGIKRNGAYAVRIL
jgi:RNA polymerase subunit RPABC4/transcription elongation factor Spt4